MSTPPIMEILLYVTILSGASAPVSCEALPDGAIQCSNGAHVTWDARRGYTTVNGIPVTRGGDAHIIFGNGITGHRTAFGWTQFNNGVAIRRDTQNIHGDAYYVQPPLYCFEVTVTKAECRAR